MDRKQRRNLLFLLPVLAVAAILLGGFLAIRVLLESNDRLAESQDTQLLKVAQSVDNDIYGHFVWYCSDLGYIAQREDLAAAEEMWLATGWSWPLMEYLKENRSSWAGGVETVLVLREGEIALSANGEEDYRPVAALGEIGGAKIALFEDGEGAPYVTMVRARGELSYAVLMDARRMFATTERQSAAGPNDRILLVDASRRYFFHRSADGIRVEKVEDMSAEERADAGLNEMMKAGTSGETTAVSYPTGGDRESYTARLMVLSAAENANGCFTVGVQNNFDETTRPLRSAAVRMALCGGLIMAGVALLLVFIVRVSQRSRWADAELELLQEKAAAMEALNAQTQELAHHQRLETIGTMTSSIAHEFNNLLTPIMGYSILILENLPPEDAESYDNAMEIYTASRKAKEIISRLSELSRKSSDGEVRNVEPDLVARRVLEVAEPARPEGVTVETALGCEGQFIRCNETQLLQLLLNLVLNAFQALEAAGGTVRVSTAPYAGNIRLRVADNGPGIPAEAKEKIFDPFFTTKGSGKGTGLGLAIVRQVAETYGGSIHLESAVGQGTAFTVIFPAAAEEEPESSEP